MNRTRPVNDTETGAERDIIIGLITDDEFIRGLIPICDPHMFRVSFARTVVQWCIEYFKSYGKSPGKDIQDIFLSRRDSIGDDDAKLIEVFLSRLSSANKSGNINYSLDKAELYLRRTKATITKDLIGQRLTSGRIDEAEELFSGYTRPVRDITKGSDPFSDKDLVIKALTPAAESNQIIPGALGHSFGPLEAGMLYAILGPTGCGKTWWLIYIALRCLFKGMNVLYISLEQSIEKITKRMYIWLSGRPTMKRAGDILVPIFDCTLNQNGACRMAKRINKVVLSTSYSEDGEMIKPDFNAAPEGYRVCTECDRTPEYKWDTWFKKLHREAITPELGLKKLRALNRSQLLRGNKLKLLCRPSKSLTVGDVETFLQNAERYDKFVPNIIITDMADKFRSTQDGRDGLNEIWMAHKALGQNYHIPILTASRSNTSRSGKKPGAGDWAEDIRKAQEIDGGFSIWQPPFLKRRGIYVCNQIKQREEDFDTEMDVAVTSCLSLGRPYLDSKYVGFNKF